MLPVRVGDFVRIGPAPDVDPHLWDTTGLVAGLGPEDRVLIELDTGADVLVRAEHVLNVDRPDFHDPYASFFDR